MDFGTTPSNANGLNSEGQPQPLSRPSVTKFLVPGDDSAVLEVTVAISDAMKRARAHDKSNLSSTLAAGIPPSELLVTRSRLERSYGMLVRALEGRDDRKSEAPCPLEEWVARRSLELDPVFSYLLLSRLQLDISPEIKQQAIEQYHGKTATYESLFYELVPDSLKSQQATQEVSSDCLLDDTTTAGEVAGAEIADFDTCPQQDPSAGPVTSPPVTSNEDTFVRLGEVSSFLRDGARLERHLTEIIICFQNDAQGTELGINPEDAEAVFWLTTDIRQNMRDVQTDFTSAVGPSACPGGSSRLDQYVDLWRDRFDPVFLYCVLAQFKRPTPPNTAEAAQRQYAALTAAYEYILGDLIPDDLKSQAAPVIARRRFFDGTHECALDDWQVVSELDQQDSGLPTGISSLDTLLNGGFRGLTIIGADEGHGKTSLALNMAIAALRSQPDLSCVFVCADEPKGGVLGKLHTLVTGFDISTLRLPAEQRSAEVNQRIADAEVDLRETLLPRLRFVEKNQLAGRDLLARLRELSSNLCRRSSTTEGLLVLDLFQSLTDLVGDAGTENGRDEKLLDVLQQFIGDTRSPGCPDGFAVLCTSEVRKVDRALLTSNDLRGSARLGSAPANILLLWPPEGTNQEGATVPRVLRVDKARYGAKGTLQLEFQHTICRFVESAKAGASKAGATRTRRRSSHDETGNEL